MDQRLQAMLDHHEITQTLAEYCHGCDRCDEGHMASVYLKDSWDDHGSVKATGPEFARVMTARILRDTETLSHMLGQSLIKVEGDEAGAETYFLAVMRNTAADGSPGCHQLGGRFLDRLVRDNGRWRIKERVVVRDWSLSVPVEQDYFAAAQLRAGFRSDDDHSYAVLRRTHGAVA
jgi:hypothetical protein